MKKILLSILTVACLFTSCKEMEQAKVTATGSIYELLVVINKAQWNGGCGDTIRTYLAAEMPCLPQSEPYFKLMQADWDLFDASLKATRNILLVDINHNRYTQPKIHFKTDMYARPQAVATLTAPSTEEMEAFLGEHGQQLQDWFLRQELQRQADFYKTFCNHDADNLLQKKFGVSMMIPADYMIIKEDDDFVWFCNDNGPKRRDIVVYSYPYTSEKIFSYEYLTAKRDSVMSRIEGYVDGAFMGTEYRVEPPQLRAITMHNAYCAELRGLWKMKNGGAMGGPFVQHTRVDEFNQRVITAEAFIYAAGQKKRNTYRQNEAILYTLKLPQDVNTLQEVNVSLEK